MALPIMCATLLSSRPLMLANVPRLKDVATMSKLLSQMGVAVVSEGASDMSLHADSIKDPTAPYELVRTMRASILVLGALVARCGRAKVSLPGGCAIGQRPVDQHLKGLVSMGARISVEHGYIHAETDRLKLRVQDTNYMFSGVPFTARTKFVGHAVRAMYASRWSRIGADQYSSCPTLRTSR